MRAKIFFIFYLVTFSVYAVEMSDSVWLPDVEISVSRTHSSVNRLPSSVSAIDSRLIEASQVLTPKDVSALAPNVYMPDYGSAMTSSVYIRGLGSRINESVLAIVVDGVPLLDKNMFDHVLQDTRRIELLRGPQGSLYGRNSPGGVMEIRTIRPLDLTTPLVRGEMGYGTSNSVHAQASIYRLARSTMGWGVSARYRRTDGFYTNAYNDEKVDDGQQAGVRVVVDGKYGDTWRFTGIVNAEWLRQGAFPYAQATTSIISYNDEASYERFILVPSLRAEFRHNDYHLDLTASYQMLHDDMRMDQDYTTAEIFTLRQQQTQHSGTFDVLLRAPQPCTWYEWQVGASTFSKNNAMTAPVTFMREGIETLILANANRGIRTVFPDDSIDIRNASLPITSDFNLYNAGVAAYHQSHFQWGRWHLNAGVRLDYEYTRMRYLSAAAVDYRFTLLMSDYERVETLIEGTQRAHYFQVLPRLAMSYERDKMTLYAYAAKGYKAGGYNPQIFSTITQNQVMTDLAADMGMRLNVADTRYSDVSITRYKPERNWTYELGAHLTLAEGFKIDVDAFHIRCYEQQVTVFPDGKTTGRMMANAARSRVWGAEAALHYRWNSGKWHGIIDASYGFTDARFIKFHDGISDYADNVIPYAPKHTLNNLFTAHYMLEKKWLNAIALSARVNMVGPIFWNEQNDCQQDAYALFGANITLEWKYIQLQLWSKNLADKEYDVFYFRSMDNDFLQKGRPRAWGVTLRFEV